MTAKENVNADGVADKNFCKQRTLDCRILFGNRCLRLLYMNFGKVQELAEVMERGMINGRRNEYTGTWHLCGM